MNEFNREDKLTLAGQYNFSMKFHTIVIIVKYFTINFNKFHVKIQCKLLIELSILVSFDYLYFKVFGNG